MHYRVLDRSLGEMDERERAVNQMEDSSLSWSDLFETLPDGTALLDEHGVMYYVNAMLTTLTGYSSSELVGQNVTMLVPPRLKDREIAARNKDGPDENGPLSTTDRSMLCRDGSELPVDFTLSPITYEGHSWACLLYTSDAADDLLCVDLGGRRI